MSSTHQAFVDECRHLKSMFNHLGYPGSLMNGIIEKCDYLCTLDAKAKSDETLRVSIPFKDQVSANAVKRQMRDLSSKIGIDVQPIYTSKKLERDLKLKEIKPRIVKQHSVVYCFKCDLCDSNDVGYTTRHLFQRIADHRYSAIGHHLRDAYAHRNIDLLNESQFRILKKCSTKWDCLVHEMLYIRTIRPNLNTQSDSMLGPNSLFNFQCFLIYSSLHYIYSISLFYFYLIMTFWKRRNVVPCFIIFYLRFFSSNVLPNLYLGLRKPS